MPAQTEPSDTSADDVGVKSGGSKDKENVVEATPAADVNLSSNIQTKPLTSHDTTELPPISHDKTEIPSVSHDETETLLISHDTTETPNDSQPEKKKETKTAILTPKPAENQRKDGCLPKECSDKPTLETSCASKEATPPEDKMCATDTGECSQ